MTSGRLRNARSIQVILHAPHWTVLKVDDAVVTDIETHLQLSFTVTRLAVCEGKDFSAAPLSHIERDTDEVHWYAVHELRISASCHPTFDAITNPDDSILDTVDTVAVGVDTLLNRGLDDWTILWIHASHEHAVVHGGVARQTPQGFQASIPLELIVFGSHAYVARPTRSIAA